MNPPLSLPAVSVTLSTHSLKNIDSVLTVVLQKFWLLGLWRGFLYRGEVLKWSVWTFGSLPFLLKKNILWNKRLQSKNIHFFLMIKIIQVNYENLESRRERIENEDKLWLIHVIIHNFSANYGRWWRTGKPGMLQSMGLQRVRHNLVTEQQQNFGAVSLCFS